MNKINCTLTLSLILLFIFNISQANQTVNKPYEKKFKLHAFQPERDIKIVGGENAEIENYPWQVSIQNNESHNCGGSIIDEQWVITAGHCIEGMNISNLRIVAGTNDMANIEPNHVYKIAEMFVHEDYEYPSPPNDIALIRVENHFDFTNPNTQPIIPVNKADVAMGLTDFDKMATITGWGRLYNNGPGPDTLQVASVPIVDPYLTNYTPETIISSKMIMAGTDSTSGCNGDSGGPLAVSSFDGGNKLAGVTSFGKGCAMIGYPGGYTRVSYFDQWIKQNVNFPDPNKYTGIWETRFEPADTQGQLPDYWQVKRNYASDGGLNGANLQETSTDPWYKISHLYGPEDSRNYVGSGEASLAVNATAPGFTWAISPEINIPENVNNPEVYFRMLQKNSSPVLHVNILHNEQWQTIASINDTQASFQEFSISLSEYSGEKIQIAFVSENNGGSDLLAIDDFCIRDLQQNFNVNIHVTDGSQDLDSVYLQLNDRVVLLSDSEGICQSSFYAGEHKLNIYKPGYYLSHQTVLIENEGQLIEILLEKIPAPAIELSTYNLNIEVQQGKQKTEVIEINNPGELTLDYNARMFSSVSPSYPDATSGGKLEIGYDDNVRAMLQTSDPEHMINAVRLTDTELAELYGNYKLSEVKYHIMSDEFEKIEIMVWAGNNGNGPGTLIYEKDITHEVVPGVWNMHQIDEPINLIEGEEYWLGYSCETYGGKPFTVDLGPMVEDRGGWHYSEGNWIQLTDLGLDNNWCLRGIFSPKEENSWISLDPSTGSIDAGNNSQISLHFDASSTDTGSYNKSLVLENNAEEPVAVPVNINVIPPLSNIEFIVKDHINNLLPGAIITLNEEDNPEGNYMFDNLQPGNYSYYIQLDGFVAAEGNLKLPTENNIIEVILIPELMQSTLLNLTLKDENGNPVPGAEVYLHNYGIQLSDENGLAGFYILPSSKTVEITAQGMEPFSSEIDILEGDNQEIILEFIKFNIDATISNTNAGTVSGSGIYNFGDNVILTANPSEGYNFSYWRENEELISINPELSFSAMENRNVEATFSIKKHKITIVNNGNGTVSPSGNVIGEVIIDHGSEITFSFNPAEGHHVQNVRLDGQSIGAQDNYLFENLAEDHVLEVSFAINTYFITVVQGENGKIIPYSGTLDPEGMIEVTYGSLQSFLIQPDEGYSIQEVIVDGENIGQPPAYSFQDIDSNHTIQASFTSSTSDINIENPKQILIFPNPFESSITIEADEQVGMIKLFNIQGQLLFSQTNNSHNICLDIGCLPVGIYVIEVTTDHNKYIQKIVKRK